MSLIVQIRQDEEYFNKLMKIKRNRGESLNETVNFLLELGIHVYLLEDLDNI